MATVKDGLYYTKEHEWIEVDGDNAPVGVSDHAQELLTDIVFVELPEVGKTVEQGKSACVVESVKSVSDVYAPISGTVSEVNTELENAPETVNSDAFGGGWLFKLSGIDAGQLDSLMDSSAYKEFVANESH